MANIIENVKEVRIRNASNGDFDLNLLLHQATIEDWKKSH